jgi:hypothetical protein
MGDIETGIALGSEVSQAFKGEPVIHNGDLYVGRLLGLMTMAGSEKKYLF